MDLVQYILRDYSELYEFRCDWHRWRCGYRLLFYCSIRTITMWSERWLAETIHFWWKCVHTFWPAKENVYNFIRVQKKKIRLQCCVNFNTATENNIFYVLTVLVVLFVHFTCWIYVDYCTYLTLLCTRYLQEKRIEFTKKKNDNLILMTIIQKLFITICYLVMYRSIQIFLIHSVLT